MTDINWKSIAEMMAKEAGALVKEYQLTIRIQRGVIAALLALLIVAVIL